MRFVIDWAGLIVGSKFYFIILFFLFWFYFVFEGNFPSTSPQGAYIWRSDLTEGFLHYRLGGLIFGGAYIWRGLFLEFYGLLLKPFRKKQDNLRGSQKLDRFPLLPPMLV